MAPISIKTVLISESVDPCCKSILEQNGIRVTEKQNMKKDELMAEIKVSLLQRLPVAEVTQGVGYKSSASQTAGHLLVSLHRLRPLLPLCTCSICARCALFHAHFFGFGPLESVTPEASAAPC